MVDRGQGIIWYDGKITGFESHAGTTPMPLRRDALATLSEIVLAVERIAKAHGPNAVGTVGEAVIAAPSRNVIPGEIAFTVDVRSPECGDAGCDRQGFARAIAEIAPRRKVEIAFDAIWRSRRPCSIRNWSTRSRTPTKTLGYSHRRITSGAGHDACNLANVVPAAMMFVPCKDGVSHNELEDATQADCTAGANVLMHTVLALAGVASCIAGMSTTENSVRGVFVDANESLAVIFERLQKPGDPEVRDPSRSRHHAGADSLRCSTAPRSPSSITPRCRPKSRSNAPGLKHVVFLGTGARSYMNPEELAELGIEVHLIKGYGDTAVAECAIALMWAAARGIAQMDREMRAGNWLREDGMQLTGKTLGLIGFGGIAAEVARIALGSGMRVIAWNRSPKKLPGVEFVDLEKLLTESDVVSLHLLLNDETRGLLSRERIDAMKPGVILVNTARGAIVDEAAMIDGAEIRPHPPCRARRLQHRAAAGGSSADQTAQRDAVGAFGVPHARGEREFDRCGVGALPEDCEGVSTAAPSYVPSQRLVERIDATRSVAVRMRGLSPQTADPHPGAFARTFSHKGRGTKILLHHLRDRLAARGRIGVAAEIPRAQRAFAERALDRRRRSRPRPASRRDAPASSRPTRSCRSGWRCPGRRYRAPSRAPARTPTGKRRAD